MLTFSPSYTCTYRNTNNTNYNIHSGVDEEKKKTFVVFLSVRISFERFRWALIEFFYITITKVKKFVKQFQNTYLRYAIKILLHTRACVTIVYLDINKSEILQIVFGTTRAGTIISYSSCDLCSRRLRKLSATLTEN